MEATESSPIDLSNSLNKIEKLSIVLQSFANADVSELQTLVPNSDFQTLNFREFKVKVQGNVFFCILSTLIRGKN